MKKFLLILAVAASSQLNAQSFNYAFNNPTWLDAPKNHAVKEQFLKSSAVGIADDRKIEYKLEGKELNMYSTYHRIIKINDDKGIEMYNKVYVPMFGIGSVSNIKARTISGNGKVIDLPADKIKEITEEGRMYKLFAMEGVEKGSEIEYTYTIKKDPTFFGTEVFQNGSTPSQKVSFTLVAPSHLKFDAKAFNGFKVSADSLIDDRRIIVGYDENVDELEEEKYAVVDPHLKRVEYKLSYNLSNNNNVRMYTWKDFAKRVFENYTTFTSNDQKALTKFSSNINISGSTDEAKILAIEDYIKTNINIDKNLVADEGGLEKMIKNKNTNDGGVVRLFAGLFEKQGVNFQIVFPVRRDEIPLDEEIENWSRVEEVLFYFPSTGKYISPASVELRYPYVPYFWAGTKGLFLKGTTIGTFKTAIGAWGEIKMEPYESHAHNMEVSVKFDKTMDTLLINSRQILMGYGASAYRPIYTFLPQDKQNEANLEIIKSVAKSTNINNIKVENSKLTDFADNKPLIISADIKSVELIEKAGNKILFKVGELIGPQAEMYQEKPRKLPIELEYPHVLERKISFEIPDGYAVKNINDLNMSIEHKDGDKLTMGFVSKYTQTGNKVDILVTESYKSLQYPLSQFEEFKNVINAAADFNKITLVLEKK
ncbi:MAG: hypothetical protein JWQ96_1589 [Segetibacter sp.]|nr:hypothetical protein [Segetibacter sp.]